jgi:hypothetical protein
VIFCHQLYRQLKTLLGNLYYSERSTREHSARERSTQERSAREHSARERATRERSALKRGGVFNKCINEMFRQRLTFSSPLAFPNPK